MTFQAFALTTFSMSAMAIFLQLRPVGWFLDEPLDRVAPLVDGSNTIAFEASSAAGIISGICPAIRPSDGRYPATELDPVAYGPTQDML